jgi:hypothetical protein
MAVANPLAYYDTATIAVAKSFMIQAPRFWKNRKKVFEFFLKVGLGCAFFVYTLEQCW